MHSADAYAFWVSLSYYEPDALTGSMMPLALRGSFSVLVIYYASVEMVLLEIAKQTSNQRTKYLSWLLRRPGISLHNSHLSPSRIAEGIADLHHKVRQSNSRCSKFSCEVNQTLVEFPAALPHQHGWIPGAPKNPLIVEVFPVVFQVTYCLVNVLVRLLHSSTQ